MGRDNRQEVLAFLLKQAEKQGYVTFDNIMDCADANSLPIQDFDWLSSAITTRGIIVYDEIPTNRVNSEQEDDDYDDYAQSDYEAVYDRIIELDPALEDFVTEVRNIKPPQRREFSQLKYQVIEGNQHARDRMIEMHLRIALRIALQRTETYDMDIQDAVGEACVGLVIAVDKYDPDVNGAFGSYAAMWIIQNISRRQPTRRALMYYPVHKKESYFMAYPLLKANGFEIDSHIVMDKEAKTLLQDKLLFTSEQIDEVLEMMIPFEFLEEAFPAFFVDEDDPTKNEGEEFEVPEELLLDIKIEDQITNKLLKDYLNKVLNTLTDREQEVLRLRYGLNDGYEKTLEEVGIIFGVTRERIRQIEAKAIRKLLHPSRSMFLKEMY